MSVIVVHGGAGNIAPAKREAVTRGCAAAAAAGWAVLDAGGSALDAVIAAVHVLEDDPVFNAGTGATLDAEGGIALDASVMVGRGLQAGAVANVPPMRHPIDLARAVMERSPHVLLVGPGALTWGRQFGLEGCTVDDLRPNPDVESIVPACSDTVGAVALDASGGLAAGTSTGGTKGRHPARAGDSPLIGCGTYADDEAGGASATGLGEAIIRVTLARACVDGLRAGGDPMEVAARHVADMTRRTGGTGGVILLDRRGRVGVAHTTPGMSWAWRRADGADAGWQKA